MLQVVQAFSEASGKHIGYEFMPRRAGDISVNYANASLAKDLLGWSATRDLATMCEDSWRWQSTNPHGYKPS